MVYVGFNLEEAREFGLDLVTATFKRFFVWFTGDIEPSWTLEEAIRKYREMLSDLEKKHGTPWYIR